LVPSSQLAHNLNAAMAGHADWHLYKNSLQSAQAVVPEAVHDPFGVLKSSPTQAGGKDHAKEELFGGGRRIRARSQEVVPYGLGAEAHQLAPYHARHGRRAKSEDSVTEYTSLQLPASGRQHQPPSNSNWRHGDEQPFSFGAEPDSARGHGQRSRVVVPDRRWRESKDEPLTLDPTGPAPPVPVRAPVDSRWRRGEAEPLQAPSPRPQHWPCRDTKWRAGEEDYQLAPKPLQSSRDRIGSDRIEPSADRHADRHPIGSQEWRRGDVQPFAIDGRQLEREPIDPKKSKMAVHKVSEGGDTQPWSLSGAPPHPPHPPHSGGGGHGGPHRDRLVAAAADAVGTGLMPALPKKAARERRVTRETAASVERLMEFNKEIKPLEEVLLNLRRGERF